MLHKGENMCGVIGAVITPDLIPVLKDVFLETRIRGRHATGLSYLKGGVIHTIIEKTSADKFLEGKNFKEYINEDGFLYIIGHIRYSTSDLRYNQPISSQDISIAHNGVISQEKKEEWKYPTEGGNDSELVLRSLEKGFHPLQDFPESSQAVVSLWAEKKQIRAFRNGKRPLWVTVTEEGTFFTSTRDIAIRAGLILKGEDAAIGAYTLFEPERCEPNKQYVVDKSNILRSEDIEVENGEDLQP